MGTRDFLVSRSVAPQDGHANGWGLSLVFDKHLNSNDCQLTAAGATWSCAKVSEDWRNLQAKFAPFGVVQSFVKTLLIYRPHRVIFDALDSITCNLARISAAAGLQTLIPSTNFIASADPDANRWSTGLLELCKQTVASEQLAQPPDSRVLPWNYGFYALGMRDHQLLLQMQEPHVSHFQGCCNVLDIGCGTGVMLEALQAKGICACGVERDPASVRFASSLGHKVIQDDAIRFLASNKDTFDGIYCSHFVEHLPIDQVHRLLELTAQALVPGGVAVMTFPDPESIRSQLLGFWRDPEHVRFYHPELIEAIALTHGLVVDYNSQNIQERKVTTFALSPSAMAPEDDPAPTLWEKCLPGLHQLRGEMRALKRQVLHQQQLIEQLWTVNQTWAWEDNAVLRLRKIKV